ncbi:unnamed protein product [Cladocopium goreaui]|uniref:Uncharacterized protein n=1 Tax=Cladocopium goreaui TaxID=2562237 RepID=A0A9P1GSW8_9DINO|nr:unnamed protein product [Cladocopium goreaui]
MAAVATLDSQSSMFRIGRNIFTHMTLEQRPESFEVLVQRYQGTGQRQDGKQEVVASGDTFGCKLRDATPVDLVANISLCSLENVDIQSKGDSNSDANLLLLQMVDSKAWSSWVTRVRSSGQHKFWIPDSGSDPACVQLRNEGLIIPSGPEPDHFVISTKGAKALEVKLQVGSTMSLEDYHKQQTSSQLPVAKQSGFELFMMMPHCGWNVAHLGRNDYYALDKDKEFCIGNAGRGFHRTYLLALLQAQALFPAGVKAIFHGQSKTYYDTMLTLAERGESAREALVNFGPNKSAVEYKNLLRTFDKKQRKNVLEKEQLDSQGLEDAEDEESIMKILQTNFSKASAQKKVRSASRKVQFPELRPQGVLSIDSSSEDDAGGDGVKDTSGLARARAPPGARGHGSRLAEAVATIQEYHQQAAEQKQVKRAEKNSRTVTNQSAEAENLDMDLDSAGAGAKRRRMFLHTTSGAAEIKRTPEPNVKDKSATADLNAPAEPAGPSEPARHLETSSRSESAAAVSATSAPDPSSSSRPTPAESANSSMSSHPAPAESAQSSSDRPDRPSSVASAPPPPAVRARDREIPSSSSSMFNLSTVWLGDIPLIKRHDKDIES